MRQKCIYNKGQYFDYSCTVLTNIVVGAKWWCMYYGAHFPNCISASQVSLSITIKLLQTYLHWLISSSRYCRSNFVFNIYRCHLGCDAM